MFFTVRDENGEIFYTRNGRFTLDQKQDVGDRYRRCGAREINGEPVELFVPGGELNIDGDGSLDGAVDANGWIVTQLLPEGKTYRCDMGKRGNTLFRAHLKLRWGSKLNKVLPRDQM